MDSLMQHHDRESPNKQMENTSNQDLRISTPLTLINILWQM